ncbi:MAG: 50S ribosomal protein L10 [Clostridiales bacterium]|nr:MAG: 50S ribosomal protein L10 [Clostridiales bacterium]
MPSEKILEEKKVIVANLAEKIKNSAAGVFVDYQGLTVEEDTKLRRELRKAGVEYSVVKNTLARFAVKEAGYDTAFDEILNGVTALALSESDVVAPAKVLCDFAKKNDKLKVKLGFTEGKVTSIEEIKEISSIPSKEDLISKTLYCLLSPIQGLAIALQAIADKQEAPAQAESVPAEAPAAE